MHDLVSFNGGIADAESVRISALSVTALYGKGVFTTLAIYNGQPFVWEKHVRRLTGDADRLKVDLSGFSLDRIRTDLDELIRRNEVKNGRARITLLDESSSELWPTGPASRTSVLITTADRAAKPTTLKLGISPYRINSASPLAGVKSSNYLERIISRAEARQDGADEAVQLNERGEVVSATMANLFWLTGERLLTPSLATGCIAGTTRGFILENLECEEVECGLEEMESADDIFLTSAGIGVVQVAEFNNRRLRRTPHPITGLLPTI